MISTKSCWIDVNTARGWVVSLPGGSQVIRECWREGVGFAAPKGSKGWCSGEVCDTGLLYAGHRGDGQGLDHVGRWTRGNGFKIK